MVGEPLVRSHRGIPITTKKPTNHQDAASDIWEQATVLLQKEIGKRLWTTWFADLHVSEITSKSIIMEAPQLAVERIKKQWLSELSNAVSDAGGHGLKITLQVAEPESTDQEKASKNTPFVAPDDTGDIGLNPRFTFDTFAEAECNSFALGRAREAALGKALDYSPLQISGPAGMGKTHLLHAIGAELIKAGKKITITTADEFTANFISAVTGKDGQNKRTKISDFRDKYRKIDALLIDGLDFFDGSKPKSVLELAEVLNELNTRSKLVVVTSRKNPLSLKVHEELKNRMHGGFTVRLAEPNTEDGAIIVKHLASAVGIKHISKEAAATLARRRQQSVSRLVSGVNSLNVYLEVTKLKPTVEAVNAALEMSTPPPEGLIDSSIVSQVVSEYFDIPWDEIISGRQTHDLTRAKHMAMYLLRTVCELPVKETARFVGLKHYSNASRAEKDITLKMKSSPSLRDSVATLIEKINEAA